MSEDEKKLTAYSGGHAIVALNEKASDPIHKATIIPRGRALGMVMRLPERDQLSVTREKMHADIAVAMGGELQKKLFLDMTKLLPEHHQISKWSRKWQKIWLQCTV